MGAGNRNLALSGEENGDIQSCEELAKYYEHVRKDFVKAKQAATSGLAMALAETAGWSPFEYRLERLERKLLKQRALSS